MVEHEGLGTPDDAPLVGRDDRPGVGHLDPGAADARRELPAGIACRDRIEGLADADAGLPVDPDRDDPRRVEGNRGERRQCRPVGRAHGADGLPPRADVAGEIPPVCLLQAPVEVGEALHPRHGHEEAPALAAHLALDAALLVGTLLARLAVAGLEAVMAAQGDESLGLDPVPPAQDPGHERPGVVVADPGGHSMEPGERDDVALEERLLTLRSEGDVDRDARVGEAQLEDRDLRALAADEDIREAEVDLRFGAGLVVGDDRHVHVVEMQLAAAGPDVPADRRLGDIGTLLVDEALPDPAGGVALLAGRDGVLGQPAPDRLGMGADRGLGAGLDGLARRRDRRRQGLADCPPVDLVPTRQLADRHPFLPLLPADTLELLHPRQLLPPSLSWPAKTNRAYGRWVGGGANFDDQTGRKWGQFR